jgi:hypothetical protein
MKTHRTFNGESPSAYAARFVLAVAASLLLSPGTSSAILAPGDCGKPLAGITSNGQPSASDALYTLRAGVGLETCVKYICDVDNSAAVNSSDALTILSAAVDLPVSLVCPPCSDSDNTYCACTKQEVLNKLDQDPNFTNKPSRDVAALFGCGASPGSPTIIAVDKTTEWTTLRREITANNVWLHAANMVIIPTAPCYGSNENNPSTCPDAGTDLFLRLRGSGVGVAGFTVKGFTDGVHFAGVDGTAANMILDRQCDDSITNEDNLGIGSEVRAGIIKRGCDKCAQDAKGPVIGSCNGRGCYHNAYYGVQFQGCETSIRFANSAQAGTFLISGGSDKPISGWPCHGADMGATDLTVTIDGFMTDQCTSGLEFGGGTFTVQGLTQLIRNTHRGVLSKAQFTNTVTIKDSKIYKNGGAGSQVPVGGAVVWRAGSLNLGTGTTNGGNCIWGNKKGGGGDREITLATDPQASVVVTANNNYWNTGGASPPNSPPVNEFVAEKLCSSYTDRFCTTNTDCVGTCSGSPKTCTNYITLECSTNADCNFGACSVTSNGTVTATTYLTSPPGPSGYCLATGPWSPP